MSPAPRRTRAALLLTCTALFPLGCKSSPTPKPGGASAAGSEAAALLAGLPPGMRSAAEARAASVGAVTIAPLPRIVRDADELGRRLQLPLSLGAQVVTLLGNAFAPLGWRIDAEEVARLSPDRPIVLALVGGKQGSPVRGAIAVTYRDANAAAASIAKLGVEQPRQEGFRVFTLAPAKSAASKQGAPTTPSRVFIASDGPRVLVGDSPIDVREAGALALEGAAGAPPSQALVQARLLIEPLARLNGVDPAALPALASMGMAGALANAQSKTKGHGDDLELTPELNAMLTAMTGAAVQPIVEASAATLSLELGGEQGFVLRTALDPKPGTRLATGTAATVPAAIDARLPIAPNDAAVTAWSPMPRVADLFRAALGAAGPAGGKTLDAVNKYAELLTGAGSCVGTQHGSVTEQTCVWPLAPGASASAAMDRFFDVVRAAAPWFGSLMGIKAPKVTVKRSKDGGVATLALSYAGLPPKTADALRRSFSARGVLNLGVGPAEGAIVVWQGVEPRAPHKLAPGAPRPPADHPLHAALARNRGADAFGYMDLMAFARGALTETSDPQSRQVAAMLSALPGFATLRAPVVFAYRGGAAATTEVQIPYATLAGITDVLRPFFGMMGAAGPAPQNR